MDILKKALEMSGKQAIINNSNVKVLLKPIDDSYKSGVNFNYLYTYADFSQGDLISINDINYLVIDKENNLVNTYNKATITKTQIITYKNKELNAYVKCIKDFLDNSSPYFSVLADEIEITIPDNNEIDINDIVSYKNSEFKILSLDNTKDGLISFIAKFNRKADPIVYSIDCTKEVTLEEEKTETITVTCKKDNVVDNKAKLIYKVLDDTICTIKDNVITALKPGSTTITITYNNVSAEIKVIVKAKQVVPEQPKQAEDFSGLFTITVPQENLEVGSTETVTLEPLRKTVVFKLSDDSVGIGKIVSQADGECVVKAIGEGYITVQAFSPSGTSLSENYILGFK